MFLLESERRRHTQEKEAAIESMAARREVLHVAPIFWVQIPSDEPIDNVFNPRDPDELVRRVDAPDGFFTFPPGTLVLGRAIESIVVPLDEAWYLKETVTAGGVELPLQCHMTAPNIQAGSSGHQVYEFYNRSAYPLTVKVGDLETTALVLKLSSPAMGARGMFKHQELDQNPIPDLRVIPFNKRF